MKLLSEPWCFDNPLKKAISRLEINEFMLLLIHTLHFHVLKLCSLTVLLLCFDTKPFDPISLAAVGIFPQFH